MIKKFNLFLVIIFFLSSCGYSPIFSKNKNSNLDILSIQSSGNSEINNYIKSGLKNYHQKDLSNEGFLVFIKTEFLKKTLAKDRTGKITDVKLTVKLDLEYKKNSSSNEAASMTFSESFNMKINENNFDQRSYEKNIKKNIAQILTNKIIRHLSIKNDT